METNDGILAQIKAINIPISRKFTVESLYKNVPQSYWWELDILLEHRKDLHDRIERYKKSRGA